MWKQNSIQRALSQRPLSALLSPSSALVLLTSTPRLEADEKRILFSQGQRDDLAQSSSNWGSLVLWAHQNILDRHIKSHPVPEARTELWRRLEIRENAHGAPASSFCAWNCPGPVSKLPPRTLRKSPELVLCRGVWPPRVCVRLGT